MNIFEQEIGKRNREPFLHDHLVWQASFRYRTADGKYIRSPNRDTYFGNETNTVVPYWSCRPSVNMKLINGKVSRLLEPSSGESDSNHRRSNRISISNSSTDWRSQTGSQGDVESITSGVDGPRVADSSIVMWEILRKRLLSS